MLKFFKNDMAKNTFILFGFALVAALALSFFNEITKEKIADLEAKSQAEAYEKVLPGVSEFKSIALGEADEKSLEIFETASDVLNKNGYVNVTVEDVVVGIDQSGKIVGYVGKVTVKGYNRLTLTFGYSLDGVCTGLEFLKLEETAGMGMKAADDAFKGQFVGRNVSEFVLVKNGASSENEIDAISGASITSNAVVKGINAGMCLIAEIKSVTGGAN